jgi:hypothetical protein
LIGSAALVAGFALAAQPAEARKPAPGKAEAKREDKATKIPPGQLHIIITLATQRVAVYSDGVLAARSNVATGVPGHPTPTGVFSVIGKARHHASNIYSGAPMPFMQRITWSGVAMHQGVVPGGRTASHGCIRLFADFASMMFGTTKIGARVIISQNELSPSEFSHPFLFTPKPGAVLATTEQKPVTPTKTAEATPSGTASDAPPVATAEPDALAIDMDSQESKKEMVRPDGPISVFVSAKEKKLFIRQNFLPIFEVPVTIKDAGQPIGTHVFTALGTSEPSKLRWLLVSVPDNLKPKAAEKSSAKNAKAAKDAKPAEPEKVSTAAEALDRIELAADVRARIEEMMGAGASFIVSDRGLGDETGEGTDFVVLTR